MVIFDEKQQRYSPSMSELRQRTSALGLQRFVPFSPKSELCRDVPFFKDCESATVSQAHQALPLQLNPVQLSYNIPPRRAQKSLGRALRGKHRCMMCVGLRVNASIMLIKNLPVFAYSGRDCQSDREVAHRLCPKYISMDA